MKTTLFVTSTKNNELAEKRTNVLRIPIFILFMPYIIVQGVQGCSIRKESQRNGYIREKVNFFVFSKPKCVLEKK